MTEYPLVSVVTPAYHMARFIGDTIESVIGQDYPNIEYIVMDGGSTDGTLDVIRRYERLATANVTFRWSSAPDAGTADAINKGFARAHGSVLAYLNADDTYANGAIRSAVQALLANPAAQAVYGDANWVGTDGAVLGPYPTQPFNPDLLRMECFICQPASFIRREAFSLVGALDASLHYAYDYEFWMRLAERYSLVKVDQLLATSRMHSRNKTLLCRRRVFRENIDVLKRHYGYVPFRHILAYSAHILDGRDQFFSPFLPSAGKYLLSLPMGLRFNLKRPARYAKEWASAMSLPALHRRLSEFVHPARLMRSEPVRRSQVRSD